MLAEKAATTSGAAQPLDAEQVVRLGLTHVVSHRPVEESTGTRDYHSHPQWASGCLSAVAKRVCVRTLR
jgi:protein tyrosine phosphatase (PTP) superfamily phosphohydrolase (DUF442 family)